MDHLSSSDTYVTTTLRPFVRRINNIAVRPSVDDWSASGQLLVSHVVSQRSTRGEFGQTLVSLCGQFIVIRWSLYKFLASLRSLLFVVSQWSVSGQLY